MLQRIFSRLRSLLTLFNHRNWVPQYIPIEDDPDDATIISDNAQAHNCTSIFTHYIKSVDGSIDLFRTGSGSDSESEPLDHITSDRDAGLSVTEMLDLTKSDNNDLLPNIPPSGKDSSNENDDIVLSLAPLEVDKYNPDDDVMVIITDEVVSTPSFVDLDDDDDDDILAGGEILAYLFYHPDDDDVITDYGYNSDSDLNSSVADIRELLPPIIERAEVAPFCERNYWSALGTEFESGETLELNERIENDTRFLVELMIWDKHDALLGRLVSPNDGPCECQACLPLSPRSTSPDPNFIPYSYTLDQLQYPRGKGPDGEGPDGAVSPTQASPREPSIWSDEDSSFDPDYRASGRNLRPLPSETDWLEGEIAEASFWVWRWPGGEEEDESDSDSSSSSLTGSLSPCSASFSTRSSSSRSVSSSTSGSIRR